MQHTVRGGLEARGRQIWNDVESWASTFFLTVEKEAERRLKPVFHRLEFASRQEVDSLSRRIDQLENRLWLEESAKHALETRGYAELFWDEA